MAVDTISTLDGILKRLYGDKVEKLNYATSPFLDMIPKRTDFSGKAMEVGIQYAGQATSSANASYAFGGSGTLAQKSFVVTANPDYAAGYVGGQAIAQGQGNGAIVDTVKWEVDSAIAKCSESLMHGLFGNGGGAIGRLTAASSVASTTVTLRNVEDMVNFEVGDLLESSATDGTSGSVKSGTVTISALDADAGTLTFSAAMNSGIASSASSDYLFKRGNFGAKISGLDAWLPTSAPGATSFFGVDRSSDVVRLGGIRVSSSARIDEALNTAVARMARGNAKPDLVVMNPTNLLALSNCLSSQSQFIAPLKTGEVGFGGFMVHSLSGGAPLKVVADLHCQVNKVYVLTTNTWTLHTAGAAPKIFDLDGKFFRVAAADAYEVRVGYYGQLYCRAPGYNCVLSIS